MTDDKAPYGRVTQKAPAVSDVHVLWITAGLSCDGDTVSITAATQPSIEDVLVETVQRTVDPSVRAATQELVEAILDLHGAGLDRMLEIVSGVADNGAAMMDRFIRDELVASVLLLHGLHPVDFDTRVRKAIETLGARPAIARRLHRARGHRRRRGARAPVAEWTRLFGLDGAAADDKDAFYEAAPDLQGLDIDEVTEPATIAVVPLSSLRRSSVGSVA